MDQHPARASQIAFAVANARSQAARGLDATDAFDQAEALLASVSADLAPTDAAALALHPWTRHIRRARHRGPTTDASARETA